MFHRIVNFYFSVGILCHFRTISAGFTCNPNLKVGFGKNSVKESDCRKFGGCWKNGYGCYFSQENIPGFRMMLGDNHLSPISKTISNIDRKQCGRECLKRSYCACFTYDSSISTCWIKTDVCHNADNNVGNKITYNKFASKEMTCGYGSCVGPVIFSKNYDVNNCSKYCSTLDFCKFIRLSASYNLVQSAVCTGGVILCDFNKDDRMNLHISTCIPGAVFPDWANNHFKNRDNITDNSDETCKILDSDENFNLRVPWPSIGNDNPNFSMEIKGNNIENCMNSNGNLQPNGVIVYVVDSWQEKIKFSGYFKACKLIAGDDLNYCLYSCSCNEDYCEAVHIRAFNTKGNNLSICNYNIQPM